MNNNSMKHLSPPNQKQQKEQYERADNNELNLYDSQLGDPIEVYYRRAQMVQDFLSSDPKLTENNVKSWHENLIHLEQSISNVTINYKNESQMPQRLKELCSIYEEIRVKFDLILKKFPDLFEILQRECQSKLKQIKNDNPSLKKVHQSPFFNYGGQIHEKEDRQTEFKNYQLNSFQKQQNSIQVQNKNHNNIYRYKDVIKKTITSFLNSQGGTIFLGIRDLDMTVQGIDLSRKDMDDMKLKLSEIRRQIEPNCNNLVNVDFIPIKKWGTFSKGKWVVRIKVSQGESNKIYAYKLGDNYQMESAFREDGSSQKYEVAKFLEAARDFAVNGRDKVEPIQYCLPDPDSHLNEANEVQYQYAQFKKDIKIFRNNNNNNNNDKMKQNDNNKPKGNYDSNQINQNYDKNKFKQEDNNNNNSFNKNPFFLSNQQGSFNNQQNFPKNPIQQNYVQPNNINIPNQGLQKPYQPQQQFNNNSNNLIGMISVNKADQTLIEELKKQISELESKLSSKIKDIRILNEDLLQVQQKDFKIKELENEIQTLNKKLRDSEEKLKSLEKDQEELKGYKDNANKYLDQTYNQSQQILNQINEINTLKTSVEVLKKELENKTDQEKMAFMLQVNSKNNNNQNQNQYQQNNPNQIEVDAQQNNAVNNIGKLSQQNQQPNLQSYSSPNVQQYQQPNFQPYQQQNLQQFQQSSQQSYQQAYQQSNQEQYQLNNQQQYKLNNQQPYQLPNQQDYNQMNNHKQYNPQQSNINQISSNNANNNTDYQNINNNLNSISNQQININQSNHNQNIYSINNNSNQSQNNNNKKDFKQQSQQNQYLDGKDRKSTEYVRKDVDQNQEQQYKQLQQQQQQQQQQQYKQKQKQNQTNQVYNKSDQQKQYQQIQIEDQWSQDIENNTSSQKQQDSRGNRIKQQQNNPQKYNQQNHQQNKNQSSSDYKKTSDKDSEFQYIKKGKPKFEEKKDDELTEALEQSKLQNNNMFSMLSQIRENPNNNQNQKKSNQILDTKNENIENNIEEEIEEDDNDVNFSQEYLFSQNNFSLDDLKNEDYDKIKYSIIICFAYEHIASDAFRAIKTICQDLQNVTVKLGNKKRIVGIFFQSEISQRRLFSQIIQFGSPINNEQLCFLKMISKIKSKQTIVYFNSDYESIQNIQHDKNLVLAYLDNVKKEDSKIKKMFKCDKIIKQKSKYLLSSQFENFFFEKNQVNNIIDNKQNNIIGKILSNKIVFEGVEKRDSLIEKIWQFIELKFIFVAPKIVEDKNSQDISIEFENSTEAYICWNYLNDQKNLSEYFKSNNKKIEIETIITIPVE